MKPISEPGVKFSRCGKCKQDTRLIIDNGKVKKWEQSAKKKMYCPWCQVIFQILWIHLGSINKINSKVAQIWACYVSC